MEWSWAQSFSGDFLKSCTLNGRQDFQLFSLLSPALAEFVIKHITALLIFQIQIWKTQFWNISCSKSFTTFPST